MLDPASISMIAALVILVILSAFFSATETAFTSLNRIRLKSRADSGNKRAALTLRIAEDYDKLLSTNLIGNNIVNISASTVGTVLFTKLFLDYGPLVSTVVLTVVILVFGEISPKSMAKENAEAFAMFKQFTAMEKAAKAAYESKFGPITQSSAACGDSYRWLDGPWPWNFQQNEVK